MRGCYIVIAALALVVFVLQLEISWIYFNILTEGSLTLIEPNRAILGTEFGLSLVVLAGAIIIMALIIGRLRNDNRRL